jgi:hypothetical protein
LWANPHSAYKAIHFSLFIAPIGHILAQSQQAVQCAEVNEDTVALLECTANLFVDLLGK